MSVEELFWSYVNYSYLIQVGVFANVWMCQITGGI